MGFKVDRVGYYAGNYATFVADDVSQCEEPVPDKSSTSDDNHFDFTVSCYVIMKLVLEKKVKVKQSRYRLEVHQRFPGN